MAAARYYELDKIKRRLNFPENFTKDDQLLNEFGQLADSEIDDQIYIYAKQYGRLQQIPAVPLQGTMVTQSIRDASSNRVVSLYLDTKGQGDAAQRWLTASNNLIKSWVMKIQVDTDIYSTII